MDKWVNLNLQIHWKGTDMTRGEEKKKVREEFFNAFQVEFFKEFENGAKILSVFGKRPQERWLYGFIGQALAKVLRAEKPMPLVLTELPVSRMGKFDDEQDEENDSSSGRVDYVFGYRGHLIYMEVKAGVLNMPWEGAEGVSRLKNKWDEAMNQLKAINLDRKLSSKFDAKKSIRFALLFTTCGKMGEKENLLDEVEVTDLKSLQEKLNSKLKAEFVGLRVNMESKPYRRNTINVYKNGKTKMRRDYGWMLFAGYK